MGPRPCRPGSEMSGPMAIQKRAMQHRPEIAGETNLAMVRATHHGVAAATGVALSPIEAPIQPSLAEWTSRSGQATGGWGTGSPMAAHIIMAPKEGL